MNKRGKTGYDVQKSLSGLMLDSQTTANTKKPFLPPGAKRKAEEDDFDDHSLFNMYTAVKRRPKDLFGGVPEKCKRKASSQCMGSGIKRSKFRNPFKICDQGDDVNEREGTSRWVLVNQCEPR